MAPRWEESRPRTRSKTSGVSTTRWRRWSKTHFHSFSDKIIQWFKGGITNICYNCLDRNVEAGNGDKIAIYWEGNDLGCDATLTYSELLQRVCQLANYLKDFGVKKGDAVVVYLPMLMELPITMLACARIGAIHSVVFAGFSAESLAQRIIDCKPKVVTSGSTGKPKTCSTSHWLDMWLHCRSLDPNRVLAANMDTGTIDVACRLHVLICWLYFLQMISFLPNS